MNLIAVQAHPIHSYEVNRSSERCRQQEHHQLRRISLAAHQSYNDSNGLVQRKKRKLSEAVIASSTSTSTTSQISLDFLSGIFQDLSDVVSTPNAAFSRTIHSHNNNSINNSISSNDVSVPKTKRCRAGSLTSVRSLATLQAQDSDQDSSDDALAAQIVDTVFASRVIDMPMFPHLPHTISASSCSSNNLTLTSVPAAQVIETHHHYYYNNNQNSTVDTTRSFCASNSQHCSMDTISSMLEEAAPTDEESEEYGFYVDLDNDSIHQRLESVTKATETCRRSLLGSHDLAFSSSILSKAEPLSEELDSDIAWAKAADTVDDVLGDLF